MGLRLRWLGTEQLTWRDLRLIVEGSPRTSAYIREVVGAAAGWGPLEHLVATLIDTVNMQRFEHPPSKYPSGSPPRRVPRPGAAEEGRRIGSDPIPTSEFDAWWDSH